MTMQRTAFLSVLLLCSATGARAADLDGTYTGTRTMTEARGVAQYCGPLNAPRPATFTVKAGTISSANVAGTASISGKIAPDGSFKMSGSIGNADADVMTITGSIRGTTLAAKFETPGKQVTCSGVLGAERGS